MESECSFKRITINNIKHKTASCSGFTGEVYHTPKDRWTPALHNLFQKMEAVYISFYADRITPVPTLETPEENSRLMPFVNVDVKIPSSMLEIESNSK